MIYCHLQYQDIKAPSFNEHIKMRKDCYEYCKSLKDPFDFIRYGVKEKRRLPSHHPYWAWLVESEKRSRDKARFTNKDNTWMWQLWCSGYKSIRDNGHFNPDNNWFGVSVFDPVLVIRKGNREVVVSLGWTDQPDWPTGDERWQIFITGKCRYIKLSKNGRVFYEDYFGNVPNDNLIKLFCANY